MYIYFSALFPLFLPGLVWRVSGFSFSQQPTCTPSWMWLRLQIVWFLFWTPLKVGTVTATTVSPASLRRAFPATVSVKHSPEASPPSCFFGCFLLPSSINCSSLPTNRSSSVSGCDWTPSEKEGWCQEGAVQDHGEPLPRRPPFPTWLGAGRDSPPQAPGQPEAEKTGLSLKAPPPLGAARHVHTQQRRRGGQRPGHALRLWLRARSSPVRWQTRAHQRPRWLSAEPDWRPCRPSASQHDSQASKARQGRRFWHDGRSQKNLFYF